MAQASAKALHQSLSQLQISQNSKATPKVKKSEPADSWEDGIDDSSSDDTDTAATPIASSAPAPPPPTPSSPSQTSLPLADRAPYRNFPPFGLDSFPSSGESSPTRQSRDGEEEERRPEKSTAVASRLIAAGIGQKAPKRTKEQLEYDASVKAQERKKRESAKEEEQRKRLEKEKARKEVWGD